VRKPAAGTASALDAGSVSDGVYRNRTFGFSYRIPAGWVLRTEEMNAPDDDDAAGGSQKSLPQGNTVGKSGRVLLGAFSRPPEARGEDVNASVVIAVESTDVYPGLKEAVQYLGPIAEVAQAQGFEVDQEPYELPVGAMVLYGEDFAKDVGERVMRQATLVMLARGWVVSFTFIGGTEDERAELVEGLSFGGDTKPQR